MHSITPLLNLSIRRLGSTIIRGLCQSSSSTTSLKRYVFPELNEKDLEEHFIHGSGPGGQNVNKASNCVLLKHLPTGLFVKVHESRSVIKNREIARQRLRKHLDNHLNGENSYEAQRIRLRDELSERKRVEKEKRRETKARLKSLADEDEMARRRKLEESDERTGD